LNGNLLICNPAGSSFQWFKDGLAIQGAVSQILEIDLLEYGIYAVDVTSNDCTVRSPDFIYLITGDDIGTAHGKIYPNPFGNMITVEWQVINSETSMVIIDALGRTVVEQSLMSGRNDIRTEHLSQGIYYLVIDKRFRFKVQKL
jgi:hypothetical protein